MNAVVANGVDVVGCNGGPEPQLNHDQQDHQQPDQQQQVANVLENKDDYVTVNGFSSQKNVTRRPRRRVNKSSICLTIILVTLFIILTLKLVVYIKYNRI